jgi:hypothetical protein
MANISPVTNLDFFATKEALKTFLKNQDRFKDYDYEGSNMNVLLDVLSYNTFYNNYYYNMAISEMFLDSASQRNSVVSHAKELNYMPRSRRSSALKCDISFSVPNSYQSNFLSIPAGTTFSGRCGNKTYVFLNDIAYVASRSASNSTLFNVTDVDLYEGRKINEILTIANTTISNKWVDTSSITLTVNGNAFTYKSEIFGVASTARVFYLQPENDGKYSVQFGQNRFGFQPTITDVIAVSYRICSGPESNGVNSLTLSSSFGGASSNTITVTSQSSGGFYAESLESIRTFAPKALQVQERAVTKRDYEILLRSRFPNIEAISVYGGDEVDPPQYGKVIISVDVTGGEGAADYEIANFKNYLKDKTPLTIEPVFVAAKFLFVDTSVNVVYDSNLTTKSSSQIKTEVQSAILTYQDTYLNDFNKTLRQSRLATFLDSVDNSIVSSDIVAKPVIQYIPVLNIASSPSFSFEDALVRPYAFDSATGFTAFTPAVSTTKFTVEGTLVAMQDDGLGNFMLVTTDAEVTRVFKSKVGTVNYTTGAIKLSNLTVDSFEGAAIKFTASTINKDVKTPKDRIISIRGEDITVTVTPLAT